MSSLRSVIFVPRNDDLSIWAVNGSVVEDHSQYCCKNLNRRQHLFFGKQLQEHLGLFSPAPVSANLKEIGISLRSGLGGMNSTAIMGEINSCPQMTSIVKLSGFNHRCAQINTDFHICVHPFYLWLNHFCLW